MFAGIAIAYVGVGHVVRPASAVAAAEASVPHDHAGADHEASGGFPLAASSAESVTSGAPCDGAAPIRSYDVVAINIDITLNRYLDHDPQGRMYILAEDLARARDEEARNARARTTQEEPAVSIGLQGDAIQPLTLRVDQGECLRINLRNDMQKESASLHIHGTSLHMLDTGAAAIATNPGAVAAPGAIVSYEWTVRDDEPEGTHYFHSHGNDREQTVHGLFGALIVEPKGARWADPNTGGDLRTGWDAIIEPQSGSAFREFALYYHEIGTENYQILARDGTLVPQLDPLTTAYRPDGRALNYRSEPFMNRLQLQQSLTGSFDESMAYSSYAFGDPATPMMRSYVGDPVKQRVIHGGSEVFHVHHVHGGAIRWRKQPGVESANFDGGLDKHPPLVPDASERIDSQSLGPSESFDIEDECGSGGCQQSVGDFLVHCHVAQHYFAGMWTIWRVYNTLQDGAASTDALPALRPLPDRADGVRAAVTSDRLAGTSVDWSGKQFSITTADLAAWVERQLPPPGTPRGYDASVLDWTKDGALYRNEPEATAGWPGYQPRAPGDRPALLFDPATGKLAYPMLHPHLAKRPPFAPGHGPAPYLDPISDGTGPPRPGENGPASVCPDGTQPKAFAINAISLPITVNPEQNIVDPDGELFVLRQQEDAVRADNALRVPLVIRANAGEDCIDVVLRSELADNAENHGFSKADIHIHFVQFDVQASDGVVTGFNYEQSVRPFATAGEKLTSPAAVGATSIILANADRYQPGILVGVGMDQDATFEVRRIAAIDGASVAFDAPLAHAHGVGEIVSSEFVRYRWYPDVQFGTAYFHDHVNALASWKHGLFGAMIAEPPGSSYHDPVTDAPLASGPIADIHTDKRLSADITGSFREIALFLQDDNPLTHVGRSTGSSLNLRAEPVESRARDPAAAFSSAAPSGDPATPVLRAYLGDPVVFRTLVGGTNDVHTLHVDGHWFRTEPYSGTSPPVDTVHLGISERYDLSIAHAGGPQAMPGDYLFFDARSFKLREGSWGVLRVLDAASGGTLRKLPGHEDVPAAAASVCPDGAPQKSFAVAAIDASLPMLDGHDGKMYVLQSDRDAVLAGTQPRQPLVLHVNLGDCIKVNLANETSSGSVSMHADMLAYDPKDSGGIEAGADGPQVIAPGASRTYTYFAHPDVGETTALLRDGGDALTNPGRGLYGAIVVGPLHAAFRDPATGADASRASAWSVDVVPSGGKAYRDFTLLFQDQDEAIGNHRMPYTTNVSGAVGINYTNAPLADRLDKAGDPSAVYRADLAGPPATPLLDAYAGDPVRIHVLAPWSEQAQVFSVEGHRWPVEPGRDGTNLISSLQVGALEAVTIDLRGGAGGGDALPGDYLYGDHREPYREAGLWGIFHVRPTGGGGTKLERLASSSGPSALAYGGGAAAILLAAVGTALLVWWRQHRRAAPTR